MLWLRTPLQVGKVPAQHSTDGSSGLFIPTDVSTQLEGA